MRVFSQTAEQAEPLGEEDEQLEEIDFADIGKLQAKVDAAASKTNPTISEMTAATASMNFFEDTTPAPIGTTSSADRIQVNPLSGALGTSPIDDDEEIIVYVAPHPRTGKSVLQDVSARNTPIPTANHRNVFPPTDTANESPTSVREIPAIDASISQAEGSSQKPFSLELGTLYPEPPSPSKQAAGLSSPDAAELPAPPAFDSVSFSFDKTTSETKKPARRMHPASTPRALLKRSRQLRRKFLRSSGFGFGLFGAAHEEAMLREVDPRRDERRRGDSDLDWGTEGGDEGRDEDAVDALSADMGGMELDEGIDLAAMKSFVHSMSAEGSGHVTMDDVADDAKIKEENEQEDTRGPESASEESEDEEGYQNAGDMRASRDSARKEKPGSEDSEDDDEEMEVVVNTEEELFISEAGDGVEGEGEDEDEDKDEDEEDEEDDDDDENGSEVETTPRRGFQARLERMRASNRKGKGKGKATKYSSDDAMSIQVTWEDGEQEWLDSIDVRS